MGQATWTSKSLLESGEGRREGDKKGKQEKV